ncbi:MAG: hypothetical protein QXX36_03780 [Candidatus Rehaiarchaeum fermentans]|nr:hypothetical protein [Candidatus Rehaiarchaeum fermentans]
MKSKKRGELEITLLVKYPYNLSLTTTLTTNYKEFKSIHLYLTTN